MSFIRPEASAALWRWREVLAAVPVGALGLYWLSGPGLLHWVAYPVLMLAGALIWVGIPRARFRGPEGGVGVVQIVEGRVSYFGPLTGGIIDLSDLTALTLDATGHPAHWELRAPGHDPLHIPVNATGADALFDAFQTLPNLNTSVLLQALDVTDGAQVVWRKTQ